MDSASARAAEFQKMFSGWRNLVSRGNLADGISAQLGPVDQQLNQGLRQMSNLRAGALKGAALQARLVTSSLTDALGRLESAAEAA